MNDDAPEPIPPASPDLPLPPGPYRIWDALSVGSTAILHELLLKSAASAIARGSNLITFTDLLAACTAAPHEDANANPTGPRKPKFNAPPSGESEDD